MEKLLAWHFTKGYALANGDDRMIILGEKLTVFGDIIPCERGLHASVRAFDALKYANGSILWRVELSGTIVADDDDKHVASERTAIAGGINVENMLRRFARLCALDVIHLWDAPEVLRIYLESGDKGFREDARFIAGAAAKNLAVVSAASHAAWAANRAALAQSWSAATGAAWLAALALALAVASGVTQSHDDAWEAVRKKQSDRFESMCLEAISETIHS